MALREEIIKITVDTKTGVFSINKLTGSLDQARKSADGTSTAIKGVSKAQSQMRSDAGLAGAAVMEFGRVLSDANYGIRGIANNVSQLASLMILLYDRTKDNGGIFKALTAQLKGPLGVLVAIQGLIALIEFLDNKFGLFNKKLSESEKALKKFNDRLAEKEGSLELMKAYGSIVQDTNADLEDQEFALQQLKKKGYDPAIGSIERFIEAQSKLAIVDSLSEIFKEETKEILLQRRELDDKITEANNKIANLRAAYSQDQLTAGGIAVSGTGGGAGGQTPADRLKALQNEVVQLTSQRGVIFDELDQLGDEFADEIKRLIDDNPFLKILLGGKTSKEVRDDVETVGDDLIKSRQYINKELLKVTLEGIKEQEAEGLNRELRELELQFFIDQRKLKAAGATNNELLIFAEDYHKDRYEIISKYMMKELKQDSKFFEKSNTRLAKFFDKQRKIRKKILDKTIKEQDDFSFEQRIRTIDKLHNLDVEALEQTYILRGLDIENNEQYQQDLLDIDQFYNNKRIVLDKERKVANIKAFKDQLSSVEDLLSKAADSRSRSLEVQSEIIDSNTQKQLQNEKLTEKERYEIRVNAEKRKEEIQKKSIQMELKYQQMLFAIKAAELVANISKDFAEGVISLKVGAANTAKNGFPQNLPLLAAYALQAGSIISGMVNAKKQAKQALANIGGGGNLGPDPSLEGIGGPTFNVVGSSGVSQIGDIIGSANEKPVKAYVVSEEITNMQQLDQRIVENAGI